MLKFIVSIAVLIVFAAEAVAGDCHAQAAAASTSCAGAVVLKARGRAAPGVVPNSQARRAGRHAQRAATLAVKAASTPVVVAQAAPCVAAVPVAQAVVLQVQPRARRVRGAAVIQGACADCASPVVSALSTGAPSAGTASATANSAGGGNAKAEANSSQPPLEPLPPSVGGVVAPPIPQASR
jgi:hypothetical protein